MVTGSKNNRQGFTLLEILIVLLIMGLIATMAWQNFSGRTERQQAEQAATRLQDVLSYAEAEALLWQKAIGLRLSQHGYDFASYDSVNKQWQRITGDAVLGPMWFDDNLQFELDNAALPESIALGDFEPTIVVAATGVLEPFQVTISYRKQKLAAVATNQQMVVEMRKVAP